MLGSGTLIFVLALVPVFVLYRTIRHLQMSLSDPARRRSACRSGIINMPLLILAAPVFMTIWMAVESRIDPEFVARSFENPGDVNLLSMFFFAADQTIRALAVDALETFRIDLSPLRHSCQSVLFCVSLVIYKGMVGLAATVWALSGLAFMTIVFEPEKRDPA